MNRIPYIFVDLDECLIHCDIHQLYDPRDGEKTIHLDDGQEYAAVLRPGALDLLDRLRSYAEYRVFMLTASSNNYANGWNSAFQLGFRPEQIYPSHMIRTNKIDESKFPNAQPYLLDNLPEHINYPKKAFLQCICPEGIRPIYYRIDAYYGPYKNNPEWNSITPEIMNDILVLFGDPKATMDSMGLNINELNWLRSL
jgi:hypothetical protein